MTADNLENVCEYCSNLGIEANGLKGQLSYLISDDQSYRPDIKTDLSEYLGLAYKIFEIELGLWTLEIEVKSGFN